MLTTRLRSSAQRVELGRLVGVLGVGEVPGRRPHRSSRRSATVLAPPPPDAGSSVRTARIPAVRSGTYGRSRVPRVRVTHRHVEIAAPAAAGSTATAPREPHHQGEAQPAVASPVAGSRQPPPLPFVSRIRLMFSLSPFGVSSPLPLVPPGSRPHTGSPRVCAGRAVAPTRLRPRENAGPQHSCFRYRSVRGEDARCGRIWLAPRLQRRRAAGRRRAPMSEREGPRA